MTRRPPTDHPAPNEADPDRGDDRQAETRQDDPRRPSGQATDPRGAGTPQAAPPPSEPGPRDPRAAVLRGLANRCPHCGEGQLMRGFLTLNAECDRCGTPLGRYPAADGPAFFTMTIMLLVLIPLFGIVWTVWRPDPLTLLAVTGAIMTLLTLILLRLIKGAFIGYLWANDEQDRGA